MAKQPFRFTLLLLSCLSIPAIVTAQTVNIPDPSLRAAIETALGKASGAPITAAEMETLTFFRALDANIGILNGLEYATNLTHLFLWNNSISDLTPLSDLTNLQFLDLQGNSVSDLSPVMGLTNLIFLGLRDNSVSELSTLVANTGFGEESGVNVKGNRLNYPSIYTHIPTLRRRGVEVKFDKRTPATPVIISGDDQIGGVNVALAQSFVVEVRDENGEVFEGVPVAFTVTAGGGTVQPETAATNAKGRAESTLTLGSDPGTNTVEVSVEGVSQTQVFNAVGTLPPPTPTTLSIVSGGNQTSLTGETLVNPFVVEVRDQYDAPMEGVTVTFAVVAGDGMLSATTATTNASGRTQTTLTLGTDPGTNTVQVSLEDSSQTDVFNAEATLPTPTPTTLSIVSGNNQIGVTGEALANPFIVEVRDQYNTPMEGVTVSYAVSAGDGSLSETTATTNASGRAQTTLTLGTDPGTKTVQVSVEGISQMAVFSAEATHPPPTPMTLSIVSGDNQTGLTGETLASPFIVEVRDQYDDPMEGVTVTIAVTAGAGSLSPATASTNADGQAESTLTLLSEPGTISVEASVEGISMVATFYAEASLPPPMPTTLSIVAGDDQSGLTGETLANPFVVEVRDQYDDPLEGVTVNFVVLTGGGSLSLEIGLTDTNGLAQSTLALGSDPGTNTVEVSVEGVSRTEVFNAQASLPPPMPTSLSIVSGVNQSGLTGEMLAEALIVEVRDQYDAPSEGVTVTFSVTAGGGSLSAATASTNADGQAESTLTLGSEPGTNSVEVSIEGISQTATFNAEASLPPPMPTDLSIVSGDNQIGITGEALAKPFVIEVRDQYDAPLEGVTVTFVVLTGGGSLSLEVGLTDANGLAQSTLNLGVDSGTNTVEVNVEVISRTVVFSAKANLPPTTLSIVSGGNQIGITGEALASPFVVEVRDQYQNTLEGVTVTFVVSAGDGSLSDASVDTDANGLAQSTLTLGPNLGTNTVTVSVTKIQERQTFNAQGIRSPLAFWIITGFDQKGVINEALDKPFVVEVRDRSGEPLPGVPVTFSVSGGGGTLSVTSVTTDNNGRAESILTLGQNPGINTVTVSVFGIKEAQTVRAIAELPPIPQDVNRDDVVNILDLVLVASVLGDKGQNLPADINGDRLVNIFDLVLVAEALGN